VNCADFDGVGYNLRLKGSFMDSFTIAVLVGGGVLILLFGLALVLDKGKPPASPAPTGKPGKR
jgi:hypothetical protein